MDLPKEIIRLILYKLPIRDVFRFISVNWWFNQMSKDGFFWQSKVEMIDHIPKRICPTWYSTAKFYVERKIPVYSRNRGDIPNFFVTFTGMDKLSTVLQSVATEHRKLNILTYFIGLQTTSYEIKISDGFHILNNNISYKFVQQFANDCPLHELKIQKQSLYYNLKYIEYIEL